MIHFCQLYFFLFVTDIAIIFVNYIFIPFVNFILFSLLGTGTDVVIFFFNQIFRIIFISLFITYIFYTYYCILLFHFCYSFFFYTHSTGTYVDNMSYPPPSPS